MLCYRKKSIICFIYNCLVMVFVITAYYGSEESNDHCTSTFFVFSGVPFDWGFIYYRLYENISAFKMDDCFV
jgi:hypothetical protein